MNKKRLAKLADTLEFGYLHLLSEQVGFNMNTAYPTWQTDKTGNNCATACCIAGWTCILFQTDASPTLWKAQKILDLSNEQVQLFVPYLGSFDLIDNKIAANTIRHFIITGIVDYDKFIKAAK